MSDFPKDSSSSQNMDSTDILEEYLTSFNQFVEAQESQLKHSNLVSDPWLWTYDGGGSTFHLVVSVMIHGNEVGPLEGLLDIMDALDSGKLNYHGKLTCFIGNPKAARQNRRFLDIDLNRVFDKEYVKNQSEKITQNGIKDLELEAKDNNESSRFPLPYEMQRVTQLFKVLDQADLYIDFHQTIVDSSQSFYICPFSKESWHWARILGGAKVWVTRHPQFGGGGLKCADEYVRQQGKASLALELGAAGFSSKARAGVWKSLNRAFAAINQLSDQATKESSLGQESKNTNTESQLNLGDELNSSVANSEEYTLVSLESLAADEPELTFYETSYRCSFDQADYALKAGFINFQSVDENEQVSDSNSPLLLAPKAGVVLFPKYPQRDEKGEALDPRPKELYRIVTPLNAHPKELWSDLFE